MNNQEYVLSWDQKCTIAVQMFNRYDPSYSDNLTDTQVIAVLNSLISRFSGRRGFEEFMNTYNSLGEKRQ